MGIWCLQGKGKQKLIGAKRISKHDQDMFPIFPLSTMGKQNKANVKQTRRVMLSKHGECDTNMENKY